MLLITAGLSAHAQSIYLSAGSGVAYTNTVDYSDPQGTLTFTRYYSSRLNAWEHNYASRLQIPPERGGITISGIPSIYLGGRMQAANGPITGSGTCVQAVYRLSAWGLSDIYMCAPVTGYAAQSQPITYVDQTRQGRTFDAYTLVPSNKQDKDKLVQTTSGWELYLADTNIKETFDVGGRLLSRRFANGQTIIFSYFPDTGTGFYPSTAPTCARAQTGTVSAGALACVTDAFGKQLTFVHELDGRIKQLIDPAGNKIQYNYGESTANAPSDALTSITYQDGKKLIYHYNENPNLFDNQGWGMLTGVTDEQNKRFITLKYDNKGRALSYEEALGHRKQVLDYTTESQPSKTFALGETYTYQIASPSEGIRRYGQLSRSCPTCSNQTQTSTYDENGNPISRTDFNGIITNYTYDITRNLETKRTEASGRPEQRTISTAWHSQLSLPTKIAEPRKVTTYVYNGDKVGTTTVTCSPNPQAYLLCKKTEQATNDTTGAQGLTPNLTAGVAAKTTSYTYNASGQVLTMDGPQAVTTDKTTYAYYTNTDSAGKWRLGDLQSITNARGHQTQFTQYNSHGQVLETINPNGQITRYTYDTRMRMLSRSVGSLTELNANQGLTTRYEYNDSGQLISIALPTRARYQLSYDDAHRLIGIQDNLNNKVVFKLDALGNRIQEDIYNPSNVRVQLRQREYNALNLLVKDIGALNQTTQYQYDANGNRIQTIDPLLHITDQQYDGLNRLTTVLQPTTLSSGRPQIKYVYDGQDQLLQVIDPRNLLTTYSLNGLGNNTQLQSPDTGITKFTYDAAGNQLTQTDAKGQLTSKSYDLLNRITSIKYADNSTVALGWDAFNNTSATAFNYGKGKLTSLTEKNAAGTVLRSIAYRYDLLGRLVEDKRVIAGKTFITSYAYGNVANAVANPSALGQLIQMTYPSGRKLNYFYDETGRINAITHTAPGKTASNYIVKDIQYHPFGTVIGWLAGNGQRYTRNTNQDGLISSYTQGGASTNPNLFNLSYDSANRITAISQISPSTQINNFNTYGYDELDRLTQAALPANLTYAYQYDQVGNRTQQKIGSQNIAYSYASTSNRLTQIGTTAQQYDANGSLINNGRNTFSYDTRGRLVQALAASNTISYEVNALGQRVRKVGSNTSVTPDMLFQYDKDGKLIAEGLSSAGTTPLREIIWLQDIPVGVITP